ncbi:hypothetical protein HW555_002326 [Spodoptera exigua]|uniref:G-protein coupled receptors family 1 profile domain-containing protein n=2 Tax=Spodoptera exigua TaxID=7107 RepID=A0A835GQI7_SPOEX|nr:hypothetical protein HW555_002326 [Spodoptera exigua]
MNTSINFSQGIISVCWVSGAGVGLLPLFGWHAGNNMPGCYFVEVMDYNYLLFLYFATIVTPSVLLAAFYAHIYRVVVKQLSEVMTVDGCRGRVPGGGTMLRVLGAAQKREVKATQNLAIIVFFFIICWIPLYTVNAIKAFMPELDIPNPLTYICIIVSHLNSAINPFLYAYHLKDFRAALKGLLCSIGGRGVTIQAAYRPPIPVRRQALERCNALRERPKVYVNSPVWLRQKEAEASITDETRAVVAATPLVPDVEPFINRAAEGSSGCHTPEGRDSEGGPYLIEANEERCQSPYKRVEELIRRVRSASADHS